VDMPVVAVVRKRTRILARAAYQIRQTLPEVGMGAAPWMKPYCENSDRRRTA